MPNTIELEPADAVLTGPTHVPENKAFHGGKSFEAIGEGFEHLERAADIINADVLDAWFDPAPGVLQKLRDFLPFLARTSPPVHAAGLIAAIARQRDLPRDCILAGGGSSDLIFACFPHLIPSNGRALILDPMYGEYLYVLNTVLGIQVKRFELVKEDSFQLDADALIARVRLEQPDLVVIVNPNSPTGRHCPRAELLHFIDRIPESVTVVVDETYIDYVGRVESIEAQACQRPNLLVIKSMSKVYALSGMRVGYLVAHPSVIQRLALWIPPWSVSLPAQLAAIEALADPDYYQQQYRQTGLLCRQLVSGLERHPQLRVYPSQANFVLLETPCSAQLLIEHMRRSNVFVRNCDSMGNRFADRFLRIAVKTQSQNERIVEALATALAQFA